MIFSGEECVFRVFRPKPAFMEVILVANGMFLEKAWHEVDFDQENAPDSGQLHRCIEIGI